MCVCLPARPPARVGKCMFYRWYLFSIIEACTGQIVHIGTVWSQPDAQPIQPLPHTVEAVGLGSQGQETQDGDMGSILGTRDFWKHEIYLQAHSVCEGDFISERV